MRWRKSSYSSGGGTNCVETASLGSQIAIHDSKDPTGAALNFPAASFFAFTSALRDGRL
ncbi:DUF397 domain-containing protein [Flindersiella endophytica]